MKKSIGANILAARRPDCPAAPCESFQPVGVPVALVPSGAAEESRGATPPDRPLARPLQSVLAENLPRIVSQVFVPDVRAIDTAQVDQVANYYHRPSLTRSGAERRGAARRSACAVLFTTPWACRTCLSSEGGGRENGSAHDILADILAQQAQLAQMPQMPQMPQPARPMRLLRGRRVTGAAPLGQLSSSSSSFSFKLQLSARE